MNDWRLLRAANPLFRAWCIENRLFLFSAPIDSADLAGTDPIIWSESPFMIVCVTEWRERDCYLGYEIATFYCPTRKYGLYTFQLNEK